MKNLKRMLSLLLAVAMLASFTVGAAFTDQSSIHQSHAFAVDVLSGMGVIGGYADGSFKPEGEITRGAFAKMVAYVMTSGKGASSAYAQSAALAFTDVDAAATLAPSIGYCAAKSYISGYADGTFRPVGKVTGVAAAKLLLGALGFTGEYTGEGWSTRVVTDGDAAGLFKGLESVDLTAALTRERAARMIWNALNYSTSGATNLFVVTDAVGTATLYQGTDPSAALAYKQLNAANVMTVRQVQSDTLAYRQFGLTVETVRDELGRPSTDYTNGKSGTDREVYTSVEKEADAVFTAPTTVNEIAYELGLSLSRSETVSFSRYRNGAFCEVLGYKRSDAGTVLGGNGFRMELYNYGDGTVDIVEIETLAARVAAVDTASPRTITLSYPGSSLADESFETNEFSAGDIVLVYRCESAAKITAVALAEKRTGSLTSLGTDYIRIDGERVDAARSIGIGLSALSVGRQYTFYCDEYGYLVYAEPLSASSAYVNYLVLGWASRAAETATSSGDDLFSDVVTTIPAVAQVRVADMQTGTISVKDLALTERNGVYFYSTVSGGLGTVVDDYSNNAYNTVCTFLVCADGSLIFDSVPAVTAVSLTKGSATVGISELATSRTRYTALTMTKDSAGVVTRVNARSVVGITAFTTYKGDAYVTLDEDGTIASIVSVKGTSAASTTVTKPAFYKGPLETDTKGTTGGFYTADGYKTYYVSASVPTGTLVKVTIANGAVTAYTPMTDGISGTITAVDSSYIQLGSTLYYFADHPWLVSDASAGYPTAELAVGQSVTLYLTADKVTVAVVH